ncbi:MAG: transcriptional regulator [Luteimonas sp.]
MVNDRYQFQGFTLDASERQLRRGDAVVELNARYLDALILLVREQGKLVSKDRFLDEVWRGIPVTEEALSQCISSLRKQLGDSASNPRFIETVPKHGYRFVAPIALAGSGDGAWLWSWRQSALLAAAGTTGAGVAGVIGGLFYGFAGATQPLAPGMGAVSLLLVMVSLTIVAALLGGAGVSVGIAASTWLPGRRGRWAIVGGAFGGMLVGALVKLLGLDAFNLLLGHTPGDITGASEGVLLGASVGFGLWFGSRNGHSPWTRRSIIAAAIAGALVGILIPLMGGRLMGGSLDLLARSFPGSRLHLDQIGTAFGEPGFGLLSQIATGLLEGGLFGACIVGAMVGFAPFFAGPEIADRQG